MNLETIEKIKTECEREVRLRQSVYPKLVAAGKKTQEDADRQIKLMALAAACFKKILDNKAPDAQQILFNKKDYEPTQTMHRWRIP